MHKIMLYIKNEMNFNIQFGTDFQMNATNTA